MASLIAPLSNLGLEEDAANTLGEISFSLGQNSTLLDIPSLLLLCFEYWVKYDAYSAQQVISVSSFEYFN